MGSPDLSVHKINRGSRYCVRVRVACAFLRQQPGEPGLSCLLVQETMKEREIVALSKSC